MTADTHAPAQFGVSGEDRRLPTGTLRTQHIAQFLIQIDQTGGVAQAFAIGRVADDQASLATVRVGREGREFALIDLIHSARPAR